MHGELAVLGKSAVSESTCSWRRKQSPLRHAKHRTRAVRRRRANSASGHFRTPLESETQPHLRYTIRSMLYLESGHGPAAQETLASHQDSNTTDRGVPSGGAKTSAAILAWTSGVRRLAGVRCDSEGRTLIGNEAGMCLGINSLTNCAPIADWAIEGLRISRPPEGNYAVVRCLKCQIRCMDGHFSIWHEGPLGADLGNNENHESLTRRRVLKTKHLTSFQGSAAKKSAVYGRRGRFGTKI